jgi:formyltetrahydrofolate hydrolase
VSHRDDVSALTRQGRDHEVIVLGRGRRARRRHRLLVGGNRAIVFGS